MNRMLTDSTRHPADHAIAGEPGTPPARWRLAVVVAVPVALAVALWRLAGPPWVLWQRPDLVAIRTLLAGSDVSDGEVILLGAAIAWTALIYLATTITLRSVALIADRMTHGARWARMTLRFTNLITVPAVRRVVDGSLAGTLLVAGWLPTSVRAVAAAEPPAISASWEAPAAHVRDATRTEAHRQVERVPVIAYTVQPGDDLWRIARQAYGDGSRYVDLFEANRGRVMPDGSRLDDPRFVRAGWVVEVPLPVRGLTIEGDTVTYRVARGDHLWGIASRFLGNGMRWGEIWELNRERAMGDGARFSNWNLVYPGWVLVLPADVIAAPPVTGGGSAATPTPQPTVRAATPHEDGTIGADHGATEVDSAEDDGITWAWPSLPRPVSVTVAGFAVLGAAALFVQRLHRMGRIGWPALRSSSARGIGDAGRVLLVTRAVATTLAAAGHPDVRVLRVDESARDLVFTLTCPASDATAVADAADTLAAALECAAAARVIGTTRLELTLAGAGAATMAIGAAAAGAPALPLPAGSDGDGGIVYLDLAGLGSMLLCGPEDFRRRRLHDWLATLAVAGGADELALRADAGAARLLEAHALLPHFGGTTPAADAAELVDELEDLIEARAAGDRVHPVVALIDVTEPGHLAVAERIAPRGPGVGVFVIGLAGADGADPAPGTFGACVCAGDEETSHDHDPTNGGRVTVVFATGERVDLETVLVRRDTSPRWREGAATIGDGAAADIAEGHQLAAPAQGDDVADAAPPGATFDWRRAIFDDEDEAPPMRATVTAAPVVPESQGEAAHDAPVMVLARPPLPAGDRDASTPSAPCDEAQPATVALAPLAAAASPELPSAVVPLATPTRQEALFVDDTATAAEPPERTMVGETVVTVSCLGRLLITVGDREVAAWPYEKGRELLALLVAHGGAPVLRQAAAEALWPEFAWDASTRHMMSNAATSLRAVVRGATGRPDLQPVTLAQGRYVLQLGVVRSDLDAFEAALRRAASLPIAEAFDEYERALALYRGDFLETEPFLWVDQYRREYRRRFLDGACRAGELAFEAGMFDRAAQFYRAAADRVPSDEDAARGLMRCCAAAGDASGVRKVYAVLASALQHELDAPRTAPSAETRALLSEFTREAGVG